MTEDNRKLNSSRYDDRSDVLRGLQKKIIMRATLIVVTVLLTAVLLFSLTAAWYNNVAGAGGLTFQAKQWDFEGSITLGATPIAMAPGDSGIVSMHITNQGQEIAAASVTVSKKSFDAMMQKRVYFYVDTPYYRNGEKMDRVYVSANSGYAYTVFPGSEIKVDETSQNAPALKWEWVYDVLGYYVLGTVTADSEPVIAEYLRPIEYDYDPMFTTFNADGTVNYATRTMTADDLIVSLSKTDGYEGTYNKETAQKVKGYYPIYVNSEGYGVWAYLCTKDEIAANSAYDTEVGQTTQSLAATVTITGSNNRDTAFEISDKDTLVSILENSSYANVKLTNNIVLTEPVDVKGGSRVYVDLNGYAITGPENSTSVFCAEPYSKLTLVNGSVLGNDSSNAVNAVGAEVVLSEVNITGVVDAIKINDMDNTSDVETRVHISDSEILALRMAVWIQAPTTNSSKISIIVENSTLEGGSYAAITGSGNRKNSDIQIIDSEIKGGYTAIYHPQSESTMTIKNSTLEGYTGLVVKGGTIDIIDATINGTGAYGDPADNMSGFSDTGDAILLESAKNYGPATINISGDKTLVTSTYAYAVRMFAGSGTATLKISISGGQFESKANAAYGDVSAFLASGYEENLVDGYYKVIEIPAVEDENSTSDASENESNSESAEQNN